MATLDVKNIDGTDTGNVNNGRISVRTGRSAAVGLSGRHQTLNSPRFSEFAVSGFDTSPPGAILKDRLDDPRYYQGDADT